MVCINVSEYNGEISKAVFSRLKDFFEISYICRNIISHAGMGERILLIGTEHIINTDLPTVNIFAPDYIINPKDNVCGISIVWSQSRNQLEALAQSSAAVITCGMSENNTFTCTSIDDARAVIAMQRVIFDVYGAKHLPFEIPVEIKSTDEIFVEMVIAAIKTLLRCQTDT